jgi:antitoxin component YwqK of YwqJK toxin-antitoxin module
MATKRPRAETHVQYHKDGSIWAKGQTIEGVPAGYWEWFRKDGTKMRSGYFEDGQQTGEWTTYDQKGRVYKVTKMKPKTVGHKAPQARQGRRPATS